MPEIYKGRATIDRIETHKATENTCEGTCTAYIDLDEHGGAIEVHGANFTEVCVRAVLIINMFNKRESPK